MVRFPFRWAVFSSAGSSAPQWSCLTNHRSRRHIKDREILSDKAQGCAAVGLQLSDVSAASLCVRNAFRWTRGCIVGGKHCLSLSRWCNPFFLSFSFIVSLWIATVAMVANPTCDLMLILIRVAHLYISYCGNVFSFCETTLRVSTRNTVSNKNGKGKSYCP